MPNENIDCLKFIEIQIFPHKYHFINILPELNCEVKKVLINLCELDLLYTFILSQSILMTNYKLTSQIIRISKRVNYKTKLLISINLHNKACLFSMLNEMIPITSKCFCQKVFCLQ